MKYIKKHPSLIKKHPLTLDEEVTVVSQQDVSTGDQETIGNVNVTHPKKVEPQGVSASLPLTQPEKSENTKEEEKNNALVPIKKDDYGHLPVELQHEEAIAKAFADYKTQTPI